MSVYSLRAATSSFRITSAASRYSRAKASCASLSTSLRFPSRRGGRGMSTPDLKILLRASSRVLRASPSCLLRPFQRASIARSISRSSRWRVARWEALDSWGLSSLPGPRSVSACGSPFRNCGRRGRSSTARARRGRDSISSNRGYWSRNWIQPAISSRSSPVPEQPMGQSRLETALPVLVVRRGKRLFSLLAELLEAADVLLGRQPARVQGIDGQVCEVIRPQVAPIANGLLRSQPFRGPRDSLLRVHRGELLEPRGLRGPQPQVDDARLLDTNEPKQLPGAVLRTGLLGHPLPPWLEPDLSLESRMRSGILGK